MKLPIRAICADCLQPIETFEEARDLVTRSGWHAYVHASHDRPRINLAIPEGFP